MIEAPRFFQGIYEFEGRGLANPVRLEPHISYTVPPNRRAQFLYGRLGNPNHELVYLLLTRNQKPMRYFPIGAQADTNISLAAIQDIWPDYTLEILIGAPESLKGTVVIDFGWVEIVDER